MHYVILLPVKNEENTIKGTIEKIVSKLKLNNKLSFLVISDSSDSTDEIVSKIENVKLLNGSNIGLGFSVLLGIKKAVKLSPDYIFIIDTDGQVDLDEIDIFIKESSENKNIDIFLSSRFLGKNLIKYDYPKINMLGTVILKNIINLFTNFKVTDSHGGIRLFKKKVGERLKLIGDHTYVQEFLIDASQNNFKVKEIPCKWLKREYGKSKVVSSILLYIFNVAPVLFIRLNLHKKLFYTLGFLGLFYFIYSLFIKNENFLTIFNISMLLLISGYLLEAVKNVILYIKRDISHND